MIFLILKSALFDVMQISFHFLSQCSYQIIYLKSKTSNFGVFDSNMTMHKVVECVDLIT